MRQVVDVPLLVLLHEVDLVEPVLDAAADLRSRFVSVPVLSLSRVCALSRPPGVPRAREQPVGTRFGLLLQPAG